MENETEEKKIDFEKVEEAARRAGGLSPRKPPPENVFEDAARRGAGLPAEPSKKTEGG